MLPRHHTDEEELIAIRKCLCRVGKVPNVVPFVSYDTLKRLEDTRQLSRMFKGVFI